jgi:hypothetical protein
VGVMFIVGLTLPATNRFLSWVFILGLLWLFCLIAGRGVTGLWRGLLIDERNMISLSRLQMISWTVIVLSGFLTAAFSNILVKSNDPLLISIPKELWMLMGISVTSLVGSPLIRTPKTNKEPKQQTLEAYSKRTNLTVAVLKEDYLKGLILCNKSPKDSKWADIFKGEGVDSAPLDLGKIQMFYFTLILVSVYIVNLATLFLGDSRKIDAFPLLSSSMIALLAISHAGYLTDKAVPRS